MWTVFLPYFDSTWFLSFVFLVYLSVDRLLSSVFFSPCVVLGGWLLWCGVNSWMGSIIWFPFICSPCCRQGLLKTDPGPQGGWVENIEIATYLSYCATLTNKWALLLLTCWSPVIGLRDWVRWVTSADSADSCSHFSHLIGHYGLLFLACGRLSQCR